MNNSIVLPLLIPLLTAAILLFFPAKIKLQRGIAVTGSLLHLIAGLFVVYEVHSKGIQTLYMGGWEPPYGIIFTADMTAALLVSAVALTGMFCIIYSFGTVGEGRERHYYYPLIQFLLAGVSGSFLTGDLFNLFVCFEVLLIASYTLLSIGGEKKQLRETLKYMVINVFSSTIFVAAIAYLYGVLGTLNMADLAERVAISGDQGILSVIGILLLFVFSLKAGLFLYFWLPGSYSAPPAAIGALFGALLTKVGIYALIRTFTLIFPIAGTDFQLWMGALAGLTMVFGAFGAIAYTDIQQIINYNVIISVGFILFGLTTATQISLEGSILYLLHDIVAKALLFMLGGLIIRAARTNRLQEMGGLIKRYPLLGWMFLSATLAIAGLPPLSGFPGKLMLVRGGLEQGHYWLTAFSLLSSLVVLYSLVRIFMKAFWGEDKLQEEACERLPLGAMVAAIGLVVIVVGMGFGAERLYSFVHEAGAVLANPSQYIKAVLQ